MTDDQTPESSAARSGNDGDLLAELIRSAGRRESPPPGAYEQVYSAARKSWQSGVQRRRSRTIGRLAAALAVVGLAAGLYVLDAPEPSAQLAGVERVVGMLESRPAVDMPWQPVGQAVTSLNRGVYLRTREGSRASLLLMGKVSLRLAAGTEVMLAAAGRVELLAGKLYVDTGGQQVSESLIEVITPAGVARDVGTQFEVRYVDDTYRLRVREGEVVLLREGRERTSESGEELAISARGSVATTRIAPDDTDWLWVQSIAPAPDIDNRPLSALLEWVARETGRPVQFQRLGLASKADVTILHGNIRNLAPMDALGVVLATTDFAYDELADGTIMIRLVKE